MSIITPKKDENGRVLSASNLQPKKSANGTVLEPTSEYSPSPEEVKARSQIIKDFTLGYMNMYTPRVEFNDLSVIGRDNVDQMLFNTYQPNNGEGYPGDVLQSWRSRAMRPIVRNKCVSIAAHATARLVFPKLFAYNKMNETQEDAATVMSGLMEWAADKSSYANSSLYRVITSLYSPASIGYTEYTEAYRKVKRPTETPGVYREEMIVDEVLSGFRDVTVPVDELYIENFYEQDIQKQGFLVWRKVISYSLAQSKYAAKYDNFKYVTAGVQTVLNDANQAFYQVYDVNMRPYDVEEIIYWNRAMDLKLVMVNGVLLTSHDNPNPRNDKLYPFDKFGYEIINNRCFYYMSLAFKMMHDANIINTLYPMIIDGTYLNLMPPMIQKGGETIGSDVIVPGSVTTLSDKDADLQAITLSTNLKAGMDSLFKVEESINQSSQDPLESGQPNPGSQTAYEISRLEQNAATVLGLFIKMISQHVRDYGRLRLGDILQYMTIADVSKIEGDDDLVYKTFLLPKSGSQNKNRKIVFDGGMTDEPMDAAMQLAESYKIMDEQGGLDSDMLLYKANPRLFRDLTYMITVDADVLNPRSEDLERAYSLELFDRLIQSPVADQEEALRLLLSADPNAKKNPDKYIAKAPMGGTPLPPMGGAMGGMPPAAPTKGGAGPLSTAMNNLPQTMSTGI